MTGSADRRWLAVLNPAAGGGRALRAWPALAAACEDAGVRLELATTRGPGHATDLVARAHADGVRRFLAVGGDGTLHELVNGLDANGGAASERSALAVAPSGTGNDWARGLGIPRSARAIAAMLRAERRQSHDLGCATLTGGAAPLRRLFINVAGVGYDADVLGRLPTFGPRSLRYVWAVASGLAGYRAPHFHVACGAVTIDEPLLVAFAAIARYAGGGLKLAPEAQSDDGLLDLVAIRAIKPLAALIRVPKLYTGQLAGDPAAILGRGAAVAITTDVPAGVEADGQLLGTTPVEFTVQRGAIDAIVPCDP
jgi:YegS/Rv2252/BmrU family lipid kinase